jgi:hypothetical protein
MARAPLFYLTVINWTNLVIFVFAAAIELFAFGHCLLQRADAFAAIGTLSKGIWLAMTGGAIVVTLLLNSQPPTGILGFIAIIVAAIYLLDVRPALRDATDGSGPW